MTDYSTRLAVREMQAIKVAEDTVRPFVGSLPAMDSAAGVYLAALKAMGRTPEQLKGLEHGKAAEIAFGIMRSGGRKPHVAMDSAAQSRRSEMFPNGDRFK